MTYDFFDISRTDWRSEMRLPEAYIIPPHGILRINLEQSDEPVEADFDENEIFVFTNSRSGEVVAFEVHSFGSYWYNQREELAKILGKHCPSKTGTIQSLLFGSAETTERIAAE